ncbi:triphosphoribosyl-dephospho-CoA synthase [Telmatocola sphagniphila]|uniref:Triphosphoribosyl-dephospho-CoA synthase n=1 Tax=Telmatocola sphagniphila TaxID=1123043 RepID=A0A8E6EVU5_9BACT|nr:triphosphoribosyl-dephospho-CoA synthase [Telmatocola sphagniphila]QVL29813.1 triphosphoribosyl-dephospho-CoA synthase [Telmatocola sphagniphila]
MIQLNLEQAVFTACLWEATARKAGNVHRYRDFDDLTYLDFVQSAHAIAPVIANMVDAPIGETVLECIKATRRVVNTNTNLGIVLLLVPLSKVEIFESEYLWKLLSATTVQDAENVYQAIRLASPGGMGKVEDQDVAKPPTLNLQAVMQMASDRDGVAAQYHEGCNFISVIGASGFFTGWLAQGLTMEQSILELQLIFLGVGDTLIRRKVGKERENEIARKAYELSMSDLQSAANRLRYRELDAYLRSEGNRLNPGTTADLITASLFVWLRTNKVDLTIPFTWTEYSN